MREAENPYIAIVMGIYQSYGIQSYGILSYGILSYGMTVLLNRSAAKVRGTQLLVSKSVNINKPKLETDMEKILTIELSNYSS